MKHPFAIFLAMLAGFVLAGCATSSHAVNQSQPVKAPNLASVNFDFILVNATNASPDLKLETSWLQDSIISGLRESGLFLNVDEACTNNDANGIKIVAIIKQVTKVSKDSRVWFGGFAGKAQVAVGVSVSDLATGRPIETFEIQAQTGASAWAGTTEEAIQRAGAKVVAEIASLDSQSARQLIEQGK